MASLNSLLTAHLIDDWSDNILSVAGRLLMAEDCSLVGFYECLLWRKISISTSGFPTAAPCYKTLSWHFT